MRSELTRWAGLIVASCALSAALLAAGVPSAPLFAALVCAVAAALFGRAPGPIPRPAQLAAQGVLGAYIGTLMQAHTVAALGSRWPAALLVGFATLLLSVGAGALLGRHRDTDSITGSLALVAGGASGLVAIARELGGDEKTVAVVQYLRVGLVTVSLPLVAALYPHVPGTSVAESGPNRPWWFDLGFTAICVGGGLAIGLATRLPAGGLLGPLVASAALSLSGVAAGATVPWLLVAAGYLVIGWQAGVGFTRESLKSMARLLPWAILLIVGVGIGCAGLGFALSAMTGVSTLDGYLATTPGGIYAVLAVAASSNVDITFVVAAQLIRVLLMLFLAPAAARGFQRRRAHRREEPPVTTGV
ncbi:AbrB family transcriptional regulator [Tsukamurella pseudospumae]|uniref:Ammonia monooxygenase n=1 Tax=Tsukamurella pseudospumae TaxID=239498 RepID=A0A137ZZ93_9ACTN|nr:AbrB family transcriptional regulator [Tsukamurella pseudospumae]KXO89358.1 hypothetical protein AXK61_12250 [Tsukamurella pseudospumae]KXP03518.1 hypothetical protein AXK60_17015 [Tsukamurella pseudospumae]